MLLDLGSGNEGERNGVFCVVFVLGFVVIVVVCEKSERVSLQVVKR